MAGYRLEVWIPEEGIERQETGKREWLSGHSYS
jgi:hypothetical protein